MNNFKSIIGIEVNNPGICIKGNGHFACICKNCMAEFDKHLETVTKEIDTVFKK